jgi:cytochrome c5
VILRALAVAVAFIGSVALADWRDYRPLPGTDIYRRYCGFCHDDGTVGAPVTGDPALWAGRVDKGIEALTDSAWLGHNAMTARNIRVELSRDQVKDAVRYILYQLPDTRFPDMPKARDCRTPGASDGSARRRHPC